MARIIYGAIITDIKGSIGGITFQKNGSGQIARLKPRKSKTNTQKQRDQQPRLKEVQKNWNELSLVNKILWNDFAAVNNKIGLDGQEKKLTGYQWFLSINENRLLFNDSILSVPPTYEIVSPIGSISFTYVGGVLCFVFNVSLGGAVVKALCNVSFILNSVSKFDFNKNRLIRIYNQTVTNSISLANDIGTAAWGQYYNSIFPPQLCNKNFYLVGYIRFIGIDSGISSLAYTTISKFVWDGSKYIIE